VAKSPAFQFYASDFLSDEKVKLMNLQERGAYITLLAHNWIEKSLPGDLDSLATLCNIDPRDMEIIWQKVGKCFKKDGKRYYNPRLRKERKKRREFIKRMVSLAKESHAPSVTSKTVRTQSKDLQSISCSALHSSSSSSSNNNNPLTPFTEQEKLVLDFLTKTEPINQIREPETCLRRWVAVYGAGAVLAGLRGVVAYCGGRPGWARPGRDWNRTIGGWLRRNQERVGNAERISKGVAIFKPMP
jgi:uncharacterized protein YdaU (DUF1376 family)